MDSQKDKKLSINTQSTNKKIYTNKKSSKVNSNKSTHSPGQERNKNSEHHKLRFEVLNHFNEIESNIY